MSPGQTWAAIFLALLLVYLCWRSPRIDTGVGVLLAVLFMAAAFYLITGDTA